MQKLIKKNKMTKKIWKKKIILFAHAADGMQVAQYQ